MKEVTHPRLARWLFLVAVFAGLNCTDTSCECGQPLPAPMAEGDKLYDAIQMRITPRAVTYLQGNLPALIDNFLTDGLTFNVPRITKEYCLGPLCIDLVICQNGCPLTAEVLSGDIDPLQPDTIGIDVLGNLEGNITISGDINCDFPVHVRTKQIHLDIKLIIDPATHLLTFDVRNIQFEITNGDYTIDCPSSYNWALELFKDDLTESLNDEIKSQLTATLDEELAKVTCLPCDFYSDGCPGASWCDAAVGYCKTNDGCRLRPLGLESYVDLGDLLSYRMPGYAGNPGLFAAPGQWDPVNVDRLVELGGLELRLIGGASAEARAQCVPQPNPVEIPSNVPPPRVDFTDFVPGTNTPYMFGLAISDSFFDWAYYKAHLTGLMCMPLGDDVSPRFFNSDLISTFIGSVNTLTNHQNVPIKLKMLPMSVPHVKLGPGTWATNADGQKIVDIPLINVYLPKLALDLYIKADQRFVRAATMVFDGLIQLNVEFTADNHLIPILKDDGMTISNVDVLNYELLVEDPDALRDLLPAVLDFAISKWANYLGTMSLPAVDGFVLEVLSVQGIVPRPGTDVFEFVGIFAELLFDPDRTVPRQTEASISAIHMPEPGSQANGDSGLPTPEVEVSVDVDPGPAAEYSWRVDDGFWHSFSSDSNLRVRDPRFLLGGEHSIQIRARSIGDYRSLDPEPIELTVTIDPDQLRTSLSGLKNGDSDEVDEPDPTPQTGCASTPSGSSAWALLMALAWGFCLARRRL